MSDGSTIAARHENVGPFMYTRGDHRRDDGYRIVLYGAYNAMGLIGTEYNGIAVLDDNRMQVWCDNICRDNSGWCYESSEPSDAQKLVFENMKKMGTEEFVAFVNAQDRCRYHV